MSSHMGALLVGVLFAGMQAPSTPMSFNFSQTDVGQVLRVIGERAGVNIIYSSQQKNLVTVRFEAENAEDAIRGATSAAGLAYRKTGKVFVVAKPAELKTALTPYYQHIKLDVPGNVDEFVARLKASLPDADIAASGRRVLIAGLPEDMVTARELAADRLTEIRSGNLPTKVVRVFNAEPDKVAIVLATLTPNVKTVVVAVEEKKGGALSLTGDEQDLAKAVEAVQQIDAATGIAPNTDTYETYDIKYAASLTLRTFLREAMPEVKVYAAPGHHEPVKASFSDLSGQMGGTGTSSGSTASSGGSSATTTAGTSSTGGSTGGSTSGAAGGDMQSPIAINSGLTDDADDKSKKLVLRGTAKAVKQAIDLLNQIDTKPLQIEVQVQVIDASPSALTETGFDWSWSSLQFEELAPGTSYTGNDGTTTPTSAGTTRDGGLGVFSRIPLRVAAVMNGLVQHKLAHILATPNVRVLDNDSANVFIGDTVRAKVTSSGSFGSQNVEIETFNVGIRLLIRPRVNADGNITMRVHPVVSTVTSTVNDIPQTSSREAETTVMVRDGETMVIGGLIRDQEVTTMKEIPILAQLPFLGELFRSRTKEKSKSNVMVFITPRIIKDSDPAPEVKKP